jgi:hypothetical protein
MRYTHAVTCQIHHHHQQYSIRVCCALLTTALLVLSLYNTRLQVNVAGHGRAGGVNYHYDGETLPFAAQHGDVFIYTDDVNHRDKAQGIKHSVSAISPQDPTALTFMFESNEQVPADFLAALQQRAPQLARQQCEPTVTSDLVRMVVPTVQIEQHEQSNMRYHTPEERQRGGE